MVVMMLVGGGLRSRSPRRTSPSPKSPRHHDHGALGTLRILDAGSQRRFGIARPRNPRRRPESHSGEADILPRGHRNDRARIAEAVRAGIDAKGPIPADTLFVPERLRAADAVLACTTTRGCRCSSTQASAAREHHARTCPSSAPRSIMDRPRPRRKPGAPMPRASPRQSSLLSSSHSHRIVLGSASGSTSCTTARARPHRDAIAPSPAIFWWKSGRRGRAHGAAHRAGGQVEAIEVDRDLAAALAARFPPFS